MACSDLTQYYLEHDLLRCKDGCIVNIDTGNVLFDPKKFITEHQENPLEIMDFINNFYDCMKYGEVIFFYQDSGRIDFDYEFRENFVCEDNPLLKQDDNEEVFVQYDKNNPKKIIPIFEDYFKIMFEDIIPYHKDWEILSDFVDYFVDPKILEQEEHHYMPRLTDLVSFDLPDPRKSKETVSSKERDNSDVMHEEPEPGMKL